MPAPIIPWAPSNIPSEIQSELRRRKTNRSFNFIGNVGTWDNGDWNQYQGPMTSWVRVCSNGRGRKHQNSSYDRPRFVLRGGKDFYQTYGFQPRAAGSSEQIIGYTPSGQPHTIENNLSTPTAILDVGGRPITKGNYPIHVPTPEISRVEATIQKELVRKVMVEWVCFSWKQLEYMAPYFLVPGISVMVEWGWNHFNPASLVNLADKSNMKKLWNNSYPLYLKNILLSKGNYDVTYGIITNFNWSIEGNKIICSTEIQSADRLYAGVAKDSTMRVNQQGSERQAPAFVTSIKSFLDKSTITNLKSVASSDDPLNTVIRLSKSSYSVLTAEGSTVSGGKGVDNQALYDIVSNIASKSPEERKIKMPYLHGIFWGRKKSDGPLYYKEATPKKTDFDGGDAPSTDETFWMNMGLIVEILNYFSGRQGVGAENMFSVDITSTIIGGHPNLISCKREVLIPNYQAPKYHFGWIGRTTNGGSYKEPPTPTRQAGEFSDATTGTTTGGGVAPVLASGGKRDLQKEGDPAEYLSQYRDGTKATTPADKIIGFTFYQFEFSGADRLIFRNDLDYWINWYRYNMIRDNPDNTLHSYSFPAKMEAQIPVKNSSETLTLEKNWSGLLSNIYISLKVFKDIVNDPSVNTYKNIYEKIFEVLMEASDQYWDLAITENEGSMVISDRNYINKSNIDAQEDKLWIFDYQDADSIIKSLRFRPQLTDAQATRAIYGITNNEETKAKFTTIEHGDLLPYIFKDDVVLPDEEKASGGESEVNKQKNYFAHLKAALTDLQVIDKDGVNQLQMTTPSLEAGKDEVIKLILPNQELLRIILHDEDSENNPMYCAVQPGITLELNMQGIGGLRTFQYFLIRNLPEPYSHRNVIFRITDVIQHLEAGNWETTIRAGLVPLTDYVKLRVSPEGGWDTPPKSQKR